MNHDQSRMVIVKTKSLKNLSSINGLHLKGFDLHIDKPSTLLGMCSRDMKQPALKAAAQSLPQWLDSQPIVAASLLRLAG